MNYKNTTNRAETATTAWIEIYEEVSNDGLYSSSSVIVVVRRVVKLGSRTSQMAVAAGQIQSEEAYDELLAADNKINPIDNKNSKVRRLYE